MSGCFTNGRIEMEAATMRLPITPREPSHNTRKEEGEDEEWMTR